ncbi:Serine C-palmitoyltransferase [Forsythia ovata]|uniref:Serine C-palmitoyltransferase n=1 Tax=Forsythia ovata TaxID=205694 RepID=A0ABD1X459_9LAMI
MIKIPYLAALTTLFSYGLLFVFGQLRDFFRKIFDFWSHSKLQAAKNFLFSAKKVPGKSAHQHRQRHFSSTTGDISSPPSLPAKSAHFSICSGIKRKKTAKARYIFSTIIAGEVDNNDGNRYILGPDISEIDVKPWVSQFI